ncbi:MAG: MFS transporter [Thermodesulfobacteriota bacterium]
MIDETSRSRYGLIRQAGTALLCRLVLNTARRFAYPFAPVLSRGLCVPLTSVKSLIAMNQAASVLGIFFGPLADRFGYRYIMLAGLGLLTLGMFTGGLLPFFGIVLAALLLAGLGKTVFDPAIQAYVGERVSFNPDYAVATYCGLKNLAATIVSRFCFSTYLPICLRRKIAPTSRFAEVFQPS